MILNQQVFQLMPSFTSLTYRSNNASLIKAIILLTMILNITNRKVVYSKLSGAFTYASNDWWVITYEPAIFNVITCDTSNVLYIDNQSWTDNSILTKTFKLDPHYQVSFTFKFWRIDYWNNKLFEVFADQENQYSKSYSDTDTLINICQDSVYSDSVIEISIIIQHTNPTLQIILKGQGTLWGISDFQLAIDECSLGCDSCSQSQCLNLKLVPISQQWITVDMPTTTIACMDYRYNWTVGTYMEIEIDLDSHIKISSKMRFLITNANNPTLTIKIDDQYVTTTQNLSQRIPWKTPYCNDIQILDVLITDLVHTNPKIKIRIDVVMPKYVAAGDNPIFGRSEFELFITASEKQINTDSQELPFEGCQLNISEFNEGCAFCVRGVCLHCQEGWQYIEQDQDCAPICGDFKLVQNEECDDGNMIPYDGCYQCQYSCPLFCKNCIKGKCIECKQPQQLMNGLCPFVCDQIQMYSVQQYTGCFNQIDNVQQNGYYQHTLFNSDNYKVFLDQGLDCNPLHYGIFGYNYNQCRVHDISWCKNQFQNICLECIDGYQLTRSKQQCSSVCNDGQIVDFEVCDDSNLIQFDGCYKCQLSCQLECSNCVNQKCLRCIEGWDLIDNQCQPNCGDGITVQTEQCDDGNQDVGDGCYECQAECSYCEICNYNNKCQVCQEHFYSVQMICLSICGDNYIEPGLEECDDGNQIQYDGCYNCQLECDTRCKKCYYGQCKDICKFDELEIDGKCSKFISEDKSILKSDDCPKGCQECVQGECLYCLQNYALLRGLCYEIKCGNGIIEPFEDCDDGNSINNDGCSIDCKIEQNWNCFSKDTQANQCFSFTEVSLQYLNQTKYYQYIQLQFSKKVILGNNSEINSFPANDSFKIMGLQSDEYLINCNPKVPISQNEFKNIQYEFSIYFYYQIKSNYIFSIFLNETILDENEILLSPTNVSIELQVPKILTRSQLTASKTLKTVGHGMMISLSCSAFLMLLLGRFSQIILLLDILQQQQFLKYLNIEYPQNVYVYFESSDFITLQPLLSYLNFPDLYQNIFSKQFQQSIGKFKEYLINADFLTNIESFIFQIFVGCTFCLLLYLYEKYISKHISLSQIITFIRKFKSKFVDSIFIFLYKFKRKNLTIQRIISKEAFIQFIYVNTQDLMFKVGLFLISNTKSEIRQKVSLLICSVYLGNIMLIFLFDLGKNKGLRTIVQINQFKHEKLILFKQFSFHFILTQMQFYPVLQSLLISLVNTSYITSILGFNLITKKIDLLTILSNEIPIIIFILLNISYDDNFQNYLSLNQQISIGFVQIGLLIFSLIGPFQQIIFECYSQWRRFKQKRSNNETQNKTTTNIFILAS